MPTAVVRDQAGSSTRYRLCVQRVGASGVKAAPGAQVGAGSTGFWTTQDTPSINKWTCSPLLSLLSQSGRSPD